MSKRLANIAWETFSALPLTEKTPFLMQSDGAPYHTLFAQQFDYALLDQLATLANEIRAIAKTRVGAEWLGREVYEAILDRRLDPANFRRQVENSGNLIPTDRFRTGSHRPARLYRYNQDVELADRGPLSDSEPADIQPSSPETSTS